MHDDIPPDDPDNKKENDNTKHAWTSLYYVGKSI